MTLEDANFKYLKKFLETNGLKKPGVDSMFCPHPDHDNTHTPAASYHVDGKDCYVKCFNENEHPKRDTFRLTDVVGFVYKLDSLEDQIKRIEDIYSIKVDRSNPKTLSTPEKMTKEKHEIIDKGEDFKDWFQKKNLSLNNGNNPGASYLKEKRGISLETANLFNCGFDPYWQSKKALEKGKNPPKSRRLIIPTSNFSYIARSIDPLPDSNYEKMKEGSVHLFNIDALNDSKREKGVFIVEGEIDCMSVVEVGGSAIGLGGIQQIESFIDQLKHYEKNINFPLIALLDNDEEGHKAQVRLIESIKEQFPDLTVVDGSDILTLYKDPNDFLIHDPEHFKELIERYSKDGLKAIQDTYRSEKSAGGFTATFLDRLKKNYMNTPISTGFESLDSLLDGGLRPGVILLAAMSSLGKTSFVHQMSDFISSTCNVDVLYFSIEMSKEDLVSRSLSRNIYNSNDSFRMTSNEIKNAKDWSKLNPDEFEILKRAFLEYEKNAQNLFIFEDGVDFPITPSAVRSCLKKHKEMFPEKRVMAVLDYLQILDCDDTQNRTDKQKIDENSKKIKQLSRDFEIPFLVISSVNRISYDRKVNLASLKESGALEYGSDVVIGFNLARLVDGSGDYDDLNEAKKDAMQENPRKIEIQVIKNRNGRVYDSCYLDYYPEFNYFTES